MDEVKKNAMKKIIEILEYEGDIYEIDSSGIYEFEILHMVGCVEQVLTFDVTVISTDEAYQSFDICGDGGGSISIDDVIYEFDSTGVYTILIEGESGCNEIELTLDITINPFIYSELDTTICEGQNYEGLEVSGVYTIESLDPNTGCPIIETITLIVLPLSDPECTVNVEEILEGEVNIFPVPTSNTLFIESNYKIKRLLLLSTTGALISSHENISSKNFEIDVSQLPGGFHIMIVETSLGRVIRKVVINE